MLYIPSKGELRYQDNLTSGGANRGTVVTSGAAAGTKGSVAQLIASTNFDSYWIRVIAANHGAAGAASDACLDILIGSATEEVLIEDLLAGYVQFLESKTWDFPLYIPSGSRISARLASRRTSTGMDVAVHLCGGTNNPPWRVGGRVDTLGISSVPNGTTITPGASGAQGSWTQIIASSARDYFAFVPSFQPTNLTAVTDRFITLGIGIGSATEELNGDGYTFNTTSDEAVNGPDANLMPVFHDVPAGTRLVMRASNSGTNDSAYDVALHAVS